MTVESALREAQKIHPLDLVSRIVYMTTMRDRGPSWSRETWQQAIDITRNGTV